MKKIVIVILSIVLIIIFFILNSDVSATTYYISTTGNDASNGLTPSTAWKTMAKVNVTSFKPGDSILFKRGDIWNLFNENNTTGLVADNSGKKGSRIVYGAYGTGAKPIITAKHSVPAWDTPGIWKRNGDVWNMTFKPFGPKRLWLSGAEAKKHPDKLVNSSEIWYWGSDVLYVFSRTNPATAFSSMEHTGTSAINNVITLTANYLTLQNLDIRGGWLNLVINGADYCIIENCNIGYDTGAMGVFICGKGSTSGHSDYGIIRNCTFDSHDLIMDKWEAENTNDGIHIRDGVHKWEIYNNTLKNWGHSAYKAITYDSVYNVSDILFHNNLITAQDCDMGRGIDISGIKGCMFGMEIYNNRIYDTPVENQIDAPGIRFYNNIIDKVRGLSYVYGYPGNGGGIVIFGSNGLVDSPNNIQIFNNTIVNCRDAGIIIDNSGTSKKEENYICNNILYNNDTDGDPDNRLNHYQIYIYPDVSTIGPHIFKNNLVYSPVNTQSVYYGRAPGIYYVRHRTIVEFNALNGTGGDVINNNIFGDPLFIDVANGDYHLKEDSPAIGGGTDVGLKTDYDGIAWLNPPNIGAFTTKSLISKSGNISSAVEIITPKIMEIPFDLPLRNHYPFSSAFNTLVNSQSITANSLAMVGEKVNRTSESLVIK
jgi:hypothetical protein